MKIGITGGSGFIGSHVVDALHDAGHEVIVIDFKVPPHREDVEYRELDILDLAATLDAAKDLDYIYHLAAVSNVNVAYEKPVYNVKLNTIGTINILEAARRHDIQRVFLASTVWVYSGTRGHDVDENSPFYMPGAGHIYTSSKIAAEFYCHDYSQLYNQPVTILRYGIPYGPRMREELVIPIFLRKAFAGEPITIAGDGLQFRNFVYVKDLAQAHVLALDPRAENQIYNLEGTEKVTIKQIAATIKQYLDDVEVVHTPARPGDYRGKIVSADKIKRELGWEATTTFEQGMRETIEWYVQKYNIPFDERRLYPLPVGL